MGYFERALLVGALIGILTGLVGTVIVLRSRVFFTQALTHATFPGAIIAALLGVNVLIGAGVFGILLVGVMLLIGRLPRQSAQVGTGVVLTGGFALGMVLQALNPQVPIQPESLLVGSILYVSDDAVAEVAIALVVVAAVLAIVRRPLAYSTFDPAGFRADGGREWLVEGVVLALTVLTAIIALPAAGAILAIALIAAPASAARLVTRTWVGMIVVAPILGAAAAVAGILLSRIAGVSAGATIAVVAAVEFLIALGISRVASLRWKPQEGVHRGRAAQDVAA